MPALPTTSRTCDRHQVADAGTGTITTDCSVRAQTATSGMDVRHPLWETQCDCVDVRNQMYRCLHLSIVPSDSEHTHDSSAVAADGIRAQALERSVGHSP